MKLTIYRTKEEELVRRCRAFDQKAQQAVYERYAPGVYGLCLRYVKETADAEDIVVGTFVKVFDKINRFKGEGSFEGWIRRIAVNESLTFIRKNKSMYVEVAIERIDNEPDYAGLSDQLEEEDLMKMISRLPIGYRTVFNLYAIEGYSHKEIADRLSITESTSKSQLSRARSLLKKELLKTEEMIKRKIQ